MAVHGSHHHSQRPFKLFADVTDDLSFEELLHAAYHRPPHRRLPLRRPRLCSSRLPRGLLHQHHHSGRLPLRSVLPLPHRVTRTAILALVIASAVRTTAAAGRRSTTLGRGPFSCGPAPGNLADHDPSHHHSSNSRRSLPGTQCPFSPAHRSQRSSPSPADTRAGALPSVLAPAPVYTQPSGGNQAGPST